MPKAERVSSARLAGKVALITGANSGIGAATAKLFIREGARVIATDISVDAVHDLADAASEVLICRHDVSNPESWDDVVAAAIGRFGRIDVLVNCAGITGGAPAIEQVSLESWQKVLDVNLTGPFLGIQRVVPHMRGRGGSIVNIASISGVIGNARASGYTASKGGIRALTSGAAIELAGEKIRVNTIHPGYIETQMTAGYRADPAIRRMMVSQTPIGRLGQPDDIAFAALYLASDEASFVTGAEFFIDGGMTAI